MNSRAKIFVFFVIAVFAILLLRLLYIQVVDGRYKREAENNILRNEVQYPPRGEIYDRNDELLVQSIPSYDLMAIPRDVKEFDTVKLAHLAGVTPERLKANLAKATAYSRRRPSIILTQMTLEAKLLFDEGSFPGFYTAYRTMRSYPRKIAGSLLGYINEVNQTVIENSSYYQSGDYIGISGIEKTYEEVLRGEKGFKITTIDVHGITKGSYKDGIYDIKPTAGTPIISSIDAVLQEFGEELMAGKVGSIIAIEPSTGEVLMMVSSPSYDPDELVGRNRGNNYMKLLENKRSPLFNRAVMSGYPPGSTFKLVTGLMALQEGTLHPHEYHSCYGGYTVGRGVKCHGHFSPVNLRQAIQTSCNAYFCYVFRNFVDSKKFGGVKGGIDKWGEYVRSFGFGSNLNSDISGESKGNVPTSEFYDKRYRNNWNSLSVISIAIGQGELGCTPLQLANLAAIIANRGYYYTPHVVREIVGSDSIDKRFSERHYTMVDPMHFDVVVEGMYDAVHREGGTARIAYVPELDICGKTGTAENSHGSDHSTFLCFAPKDEPKIAVSVYVEHGGWGATVSAPIASLIVEKYLTGEISRPQLVDHITNMHINYPYYDNKR